MTTCDLCGKDIETRSDRISLYSGTLTNRSISKPQIAGSKTYSTFENVRPVILTICHRHKRDLWIQRLVAGFFAFIILYFPVLWLVSRFLPGETRNELILIAVIALILSLTASFLLARFVKYDGLIASLLTIEGKKKGSTTEYFTEKKYKRFAALPPVS